MSKKRELLIRAYVVLFGLILIAALLVGKTVKVGWIEGSAWREKGDSTKLKFVDIEADRGDIYSSEGQLLASSIPYFDLHMDFASEAMTDYLFNAHVDSLSYQLSKFVFKNESHGSIKRLLIRRRKAGDRYFSIKRNATFDELQRIRQFPLIRLGKYKGGLIVERKTKRIKPYKMLASRTIGLYRQNAPSVGLEGYFDDILKGEAGKRLMQKVGNRVWVPVKDLSEIQPKRGLDIMTTLDMRMQDIAHGALLEALEKHDAEFGTTIIMEVSTGAIKAMVNLDEEDGSWWEGYNHAIADATEPGSTFKLATIMALLEDGFIDISDSVRVNYGSDAFGQYTIHDSQRRPFKETTIMHSFEISSNVAMANLVSQYYMEKPRAGLFISRMKQFGLDKKTEIEIMGEGSPMIKKPDDPAWSHSTTLPWMAHGYELHITPLQILSFYNAVANNGRKMKPYLVSKIIDQGKVVDVFKPQTAIASIASAQTIRLAKSLLEGVVLRGTGSNLYTSKYSFAGKSGTAKLEYWTGENLYQASFIGYFPVESPKYSCIVLINKPKKHGYYGGTVAGQVFRKIMDKLFSTDPELMPYVFNDMMALNEVGFPLYDVGYVEDLVEVLSFAGLPFEHQTDTEWGVLLPGEQDIAIENRIVKNDIVPSVVGMGLKDALFLLENLGLDVRFNGSGRVVSQSIEPGTKTNGQTIMLYLT